MEIDAARRGVEDGGELVHGAHAGPVIVPLLNASVQDGGRPSLELAPADGERLQSAARAGGAIKFAYLSPDFANPTGAQWSPETARAVLDLPLNFANIIALPVLLASRGLSGTDHVDGEREQP